MSSFTFGEIIEPSTRALIDEDLDEYPEYVEITPKWEGTFETPNVIDSLIFIESKIVKDLLHNCVLENLKPICKLINGGIEIFALGNDQYLVLYSEEKELNIGQIIEALEKWINTSKAIYAITSNSTHAYQNPYLMERPTNLIRVLSTSENKYDYIRLEQPNLVTGLGAGVLSYCIHQAPKKCTLFVIYIDNSQQYYFNSSAILEVFKKVNLTIKNCIIKEKILNTSNLYM